MPAAWSTSPASPARPCEADAVSAPAAGTREFLVVSGTYLGFTLGDGALRMLVLLHFARAGLSPLAIALLFLLYEAAGIAANLAGGWLATRFGMARMLVSGLLLQVAGLLVLSALPADLGVGASIAWVAAAQGMCGIAKDLAKTAGKSAVRLSAGGAPGRLMNLVAWFTGSKNAAKGAGFFLGAALLEAAGYRGALWILAAAMALPLALAAAGLPPLLGKARASRSVRALLSRDAAINRLSLARLFLFGSRDAWFALGLPLHLQAAGWSMAAVGAWLAAWTICYGLAQAAAPAAIPRSADGLSREVPAARLLAALLAGVPVAIAMSLATDRASPDAVLALGLAAFGLVFAANSAVHSYLVLAYAGRDAAAEDVGFYYAANAAGRLVGTVLSGVLATSGGLVACLWGSAAMLAACALASIALPASRGPRRGP
ncbi:MAG: organoarsenical effux MFS transporter ArsJ [Alphaproteobacteria bacterium]|nr:organoarsenical effux MFS transporter ArsJ [Alphaproteobacteria bacterium]